MSSGPGAQDIPEGFPNLRDELGSAVREDVQGDTIKAKNMID